MNIRYLKHNKCIFIAYGYELLVPEKLPYIIRINAKWKGKAKNVRFALFTDEQWGIMGNSYDTAEEFGFGGDFRNHINDSVLIQDIIEECEEWQSPKINSWINAYCKKRLIAAIICKEEIKEFRAEWRLLSEDDRAQEIISFFSEDFLKIHNVKDSHEKGDIETSKKQVAYYFKNRDKPFFRAGRCAEEDIKIAEMACSHIFQPKPIVHKPEKIIPFSWSADPMNFAQWTIAWNRHGHWVSLARAYKVENDERYTKEFVFELSKWMEQIPIFLNQKIALILGTVYEPGRLSHYLDSGLRLVQTWWESFEIFRRCEEMSSDDIMKFLDGIISQAEYLADDRAEDIYGNWGAAAAAGLLTTAVMLPECKLAEKWKKIAICRIKKMMDAQFYPDGAQIELTPTYQCAAVEHIVSALKTAKDNGVEIDIDLDRFESIFEYLLKIATPNRTSPPFNDSPWKQLGPIFKTAYRLFDDRDDFLWFADDGKSGSIPDIKSVFLPYAGYSIMRTGYREDDYYTAFDVGPFGFSHQHEDKLNFVISCGSTRLLTEGGVYNYDYSPHHLYALSSRAHNVILVDGMPQRRAGKTETYTTIVPIECDWNSTDELDYAKGCYRDGFSDGTNFVNVIHERQLWFNKKVKSWTVCDTLTPEDNEEHDYEALFHFDADEITHSVKENRITIKNDGKILTMKPKEEIDFAVKIVNGVTEPEVQGWSRLDSGEVVPRPAVSFIWKCKGKICVTWEINIC